jgi:hypothetical protein
MKAITLRDLPPELKRAVEERAEREGLSLNRTVIRMLQEATGLGPSGKREVVRHHDLDHLAGTWTKEEADEFDRALAEQRQIDEEMWK